MGYNRNDWEFEHTASKVAVAARAQLEYRQSRVKFWEGKKEEVRAEITSKGLEIYEPETEKLGYGTSSNAYAGGPGARIKIDPELQLRLTEASAKAKENREKVAEYEAWVQVLEGNPEARLHLKHDDWMYFFGRR